MAFRCKKEDKNSIKYLNYVKTLELFSRFDKILI